MAIIKGVELFASVYCNDGRLITKKRLKDTYTATNQAIVDGFTPKVKIGNGHDDNFIDGEISNLLLTGDVITGDITVSEEVYAALNDKKLSDDRSVEISNDFTLSDGKKIGGVITGVLIGAGLPAQHSLASMFSASERWQASSVEVFTNSDTPEKNKTEVKLMEVDKEYFESLLAERDTLKKENTELKSKPVKEIETFTSENKSLKDELEAEKKKVEMFTAIERDRFLEELKITEVKKAPAIQYFTNLMSVYSGDMEKVKSEMKVVFGNETEPHTEKSVAENFTSNNSHDFSDGVKITGNLSVVEAK